MFKLKKKTLVLGKKRIKRNTTKLRISNQLRGQESGVHSTVKIGTFIVSVNLP